MTKFVCGAKPSPIDERDYKFAMLGGAAPVEPYQSTVPIGEVWNQGTSSQCGGCAGSTYRREREYVQNGHDDRFSHTYIYGMDSYTGEGMYGRNLASILCRGVPHEQPWEAWNTKPQAQTVVDVHKSKLADECHTYRASSYYFCTTWTEILNAIRTCNGCVIMVPCYSNWTAPYKGIIGKDFGSLWGYHFIFAKDYVQKSNGAYRIRFVNSWGDSWGDKGCGYLDTDVNKFREAFAIVDNVDEVKKMLNFKDVSKDAWYKESVDKAVEYGLMDGTDPGMFEPDKPLTRAQAAAISVRIYEKVLEKIGKDWALKG